MTPLEALEERGEVWRSGSTQSSRNAIHLNPRCSRLKQEPKKITHRSSLPLRGETCTFCDPDKGTRPCEQADAPETEGST